MVLFLLKSLLIQTKSISTCPVCPVRLSVLIWNARVLRTGSGQNGPAHGSERLSSPAPVGQSAGIWRVVAGKNERARLESKCFKTNISYTFI